MVNECLSAILLDKQALFDKSWELWIKYLSDALRDVYDALDSDQIGCTLYYISLFPKFDFSFVSFSNWPLLLKCCNMSKGYRPIPG